MSCWFCGGNAKPVDPGGVGMDGDEWLGFGTGRSESGDGLMYRPSGRALSIAGLCCDGRRPMAGRCREPV